MLSEDLRKDIEEEIERAQAGAFVVDMQLKRGRPSILNIKVDTDEGISLSECAAISRELGRMLEEDKRMDFRYNLEVSSPGVGYPLKLHRQYVNNIGRHLEVNLPDNVRRKGKLLEVTDEAIHLEPLPTKKKKRKKKASDPEAAEISPWIAFADITEAKVIIIF
ncbi:MAG: hypothetical protein AAF206_06635 [Bacteroidota bacterium]